jgi:hypothetical protein
MPRFEDASHAVANDEQSGEEDEHTDGGELGASQAGPSNDKDGKARVTANGKRKRPGGKGKRKIAIGESLSSKLSSCWCSSPFDHASSKQLHTYMSYRRHSQTITDFSTAFHYTAEYIQDKNRRAVTFSKRKAGIFTKVSMKLIALSYRIR